MIERTRLLPRTEYVRDARLFVVAVEGEKQEPWYFDGLRDHGLVPPTRVKLVVLSPNEGESAPEHAAERLARYLDETRLIEQDERWLVVDVDGHHNLGPTLKQAKEGGWDVAVSNPCFEIWLQLHFKERAAGESPKAAKRAWGEIRNARGPGWPFDAAGVQCAIERAATADRGAAVPDAPGTHVHRLVRMLVHAA